MDDNVDRTLLARRAVAELLKLREWCYWAGFMHAAPSSVQAAGSAEVAIRALEGLAGLPPTELPEITPF